MRDTTPVVAEKAAPPSPEVIVELRQQQRMLAELIGARQTQATPTGPRFCAAAAQRARGNFDGVNMC